MGPNHKEITAAVLETAEKLGAEKGVTKLAMSLTEEVITTINGKSTNSFVRSLASAFVICVLVADSMVNAMLEGTKDDLTTLILRRVCQALVAMSDANKAINEEEGTDVKLEDCDNARVLRCMVRSKMLLEHGHESE